MCRALHQPLGTQQDAGGHAVQGSDQPADEYPFQKLTDDRSEARSEMETAGGREVGDTL